MCVGREGKKGQLNDANWEMVFWGKFNKLAFIKSDKRFLNETTGRWLD